MIEFELNGRRVALSADPATPLLWVLRDHLAMTGTKFGCGMALCGACTVHLDGAAVRSCVTPLSAVAGRKVRTIEAMEDDAVGRAVQKAWIEHDVVQCGYCQSGQIMSAVELLKRTPQPTDEDIVAALSGNLCRCGTYQRIKAAVHAAVRELTA